MGRGLFLWIKVFWANPIVPNQFRTFSTVLRNPSFGATPVAFEIPTKKSAPAIWTTARHEIGGAVVIPLDRSRVSCRYNDRKRDHIHKLTGSYY